MTHFLAFEVTQSDNVFSRGIVRKHAHELQTDHVRIKVEYSDVNYKDALAATKHSGVISDYPKVIGIDLAGSVIESKTEKWKAGDKVLVTGFGLGITDNGGFSQIQDVPAAWLVALPQDLTTQEAMSFGTAGFTAALAVQSLLKQELEKDAPILVTGATGGVASLVLALLQELGFSNVMALSSKAAQTDYLRSLGAKEILTAQELLPEKSRPLAKQKFAAIIDTVGGDILAGLLPFVRYKGCAILCGNASGNQLNTTVLPFILRSIQLIGIDSVNVAIESRPAIWQFLADHKKVLKKIQSQTISLTDLDETFEALLAGGHVGRTIIEMEVRK